MSPGSARLPSATAALAGVPAGIQGTGPWIGRRQLFVRFAGETETATIYTADALRVELGRQAGRSRCHGITISGRDPLREEEFILAAFRQDVALPVMLSHDGQRPEGLSALLGTLALVQVTLNGTEQGASLERACESVRIAAGKKVAHALVIVPADSASDPQLLRIVEQAHAASAATAIVLHPSVQSATDRDRRWIAWLERATAVHDDVRILPSLPAPTGMS